jgi:hypothetical protein
LARPQRPTLSYVRAGIRPLLLASGAVLVALGLAAFRGSAARSPDGPGDGHGHGGGASRVAWLLALPSLVLILVAPPALGSYAAGQRAVPVAYWVGQGTPNFRRPTEPSAAPCPVAPPRDRYEHSLFGY